jgi:hypothetical protein
MYVHELLALAAYAIVGTGLALGDSLMLHIGDISRVANGKQVPLLLIVRQCR